MSVVTPALLRAFMPYARATQMPRAGRSPSFVGARCSAHAPATARPEHEDTDDRREQHEPAVAVARIAAARIAATPTAGTAVVARIEGAGEAVVAAVAVGVAALVRIV